MKPIFASLALLGLAGLSFVAAESFTIGTSTTTLQVANFNVGTLTITNPVSTLDVGTLHLSSMVANSVPVFDGNTNMVPSSMTTNVLDLLYTESGNLTNWGKLPTNTFASIASQTYQATNANLTTLANPSSVYGAPVLSDGANTIFLPHALGQSIFDDFLGFTGASPGGGLLNWAAEVNATGTAVASAGSTTNPGQVSLTISTSASSRAGIYVLSTTGTDVMLGAGIWFFEYLVKIQALSDVTDTYRIRLGPGNNRVEVDFTDGVYFRYTDTVNSGLWEGVCRSNNVETATSLGIAPSTSFQKLGILVNSDASLVTFYTNGVSAGTCNLHIPVSRSMGLSNIGLYRTAGTSNSRSMTLDYVYFYYKLNASR